MTYANDEPILGYTRSAEQHRRNARMGPAHIARPLRRIKAHRTAVIALNRPARSPESLVLADPDYLFFRKAADLGMGHVVRAGARALL